ncbi:WD40 repeat domain-containing protein [Chloropicon primus]|uniref:WD40 repeat domain-containing protein n=1 Tax=Chloropicon primus TaxID=1764295 RepID=A0A5B8MKB5_9CHLO|nr:WD40 repeat domain-containing protein [Chloropicon primus]UPR00104.1 WD40 repeat domain-containing protein [Chloropicon primus]|eukprot:QDZ20893.1 WD40 repeat domain-containing protein [Chloropicon primus]
MEEDAETDEVDVGAGLSDASECASEDSVECDVFLEALVEVDRDMLEEWSERSCSGGRGKGSSGSDSRAKTKSSSPNGSSPDGADWGGEGGELGVDDDGELKVSLSESLSHLRGLVQSPSASPRDVASLIRAREAKGQLSRLKRARILSEVLPQGEPELMDVGISRAYSGHFSDDGSVFVAGFQNEAIRLYEVADRAHQQPWKLRKEVVPRDINWTVTDTVLSPQEPILAYSTISPVVHAVKYEWGEDSGAENSGASPDAHAALNFGGSNTEAAFGIWALEFSSDGKHLLAGSSDCMTYLYDVEAQELVFGATSHLDDVNTVCFAGQDDQVFLSGSDDAMIKCWDKRCGAPGGPGLSRPQGVLQGHTEGVTYISPRKDGRYFVSNAKDQKLKVWDLRLMGSPDSKGSKGRVSKFEWDYRWQDYPGDVETVKHPGDRSVMTFTGHKVVQTLIRCRWSPAETTGQRYVISGSQCGGLFVFDTLTGGTAGVLEHHKSVLRDCDWHPHRPMLASVGWDGHVVRWHNFTDKSEVGGSKKKHK